jgi:hypothetical protein
MRLLGEAHGGFGEAVHGDRAEFAHAGSVGEGVHGGLVLGEGCLVVALHEGDRSALHGLRGEFLGELHAPRDLELRLGLHTRGGALGGAAGDGSGGEETSREQCCGENACLQLRLEGVVPEVHESKGLSV